MRRVPSATQRRGETRLTLSLYEAMILATAITHLRSSVICLLVERMSSFTAARARSSLAISGSSFLVVCAQHPKHSDNQSAFSYLTRNATHRRKTHAPHCNRCAVLSCRRAGEREMIAERRTRKEDRSKGQVGAGAGAGAVRTWAVMRSGWNLNGLALIATGALGDLSASASASASIRANSSASSSYSPTNQHKTEPQYSVSSRSAHLALPPSHCSHTQRLAFPLRPRRCRRR